MHLESIISWKFRIFNFETVENKDTFCNFVRRKEKTDTLCPNLKGGSASLAIHQFVNLDMSNPAEECSKKAKDIQDVFGEIDKWSAKNNAGCKEAFSFGLRKLKYQVQGTIPFKLKALTPALVGSSIAYARGWSL